MERLVTRLGGEVSNSAVHGAARLWGLRRPMMLWPTLTCGRATAFKPGGHCRPTKEGCAELRAGRATSLWNPFSFFLSGPRYRSEVGNGGGAPHSQITDPLSSPVSGY